MTGEGDRAEALRAEELLLALKYGAHDPPRDLDAEDLTTGGPANAEHRIQVYTELLDFARRVDRMDGSEGLSRVSAVDLAARRRAMALGTKVFELHLAFWTKELERLQANPASDEARSIELGAVESGSIGTAC